MNARQLSANLLLYETLLELHTVNRSSYCVPDVNEMKIRKEQQTNISKHEKTLFERNQATENIVGHFLPGYFLANFDKNYTSMEENVCLTFLLKPQK